jgi:hypothetical protein
MPFEALREQGAEDKRMFSKKKDPKIATPGPGSALFTESKLKSFW